MRTFRLRRWAAELWDFVWEVLCQGKVIKERPLPGVAHAFVFWGFLAFALVSLNHFATGVRLGFLPADSYLWDGSIFTLRRCGRCAGGGIHCGIVCPAVLCAAGMAGQEGVVRVGVYCVSDLCADGHLSRGLFCAGGRERRCMVLWWAHTLALLIFLPLIPHTKHLHLGAEPGDGVFEAGRVFEDSEAGRAMRTLGWLRARM